MIKFVKGNRCAVSWGLTFLLLAAMFVCPAMAEEAAAPEDDTAEIVLEVTLEIGGDVPDEDVPFAFILEADEGSPLPVATTTVVTGAGETEFDEIVFTDPGDYSYTVYQRDDGVENYVYDQSYYVVNVEVRYDAAGQLIATYDAYNGLSRVAKEPEIVFINLYDDPNPDPIIEYPETTAPADAPQTGENSQLYLWITLMSLAAIVMIVCIRHVDGNHHRDRSHDHDHR